MKTNNKQNLQFNTFPSDLTDGTNPEYDETVGFLQSLHDFNSSEDITLDDLDFPYDDYEDDDEEISENTDSSYEVIYNHDTIKSDLSNVIGHENQKEELLRIIDWFNRSKELKARGVTIPKGVVLFGAPGNGKSLLIKEIIKCIDAPVIIFKGGKSNISRGIINVFNKAKELGHSIVVIDEIDLLINDDNRIIRTLQECLDGVESNDDVLVLTATNYLNAIPAALKRNGRLEKIISIPNPNGDEALELFKKCINEFGLKLPDDFDEDEYKISLNGVNFVAIKSIVNDVVLCNGFDNITCKMLDESIYKITEGITDSKKNNCYEVAIHEAAHAVMAHNYKEYFVINHLKMKGGSGLFTAKPVKDEYTSYGQAIANIKVAMAGVIAEKYLLNEGSNGCESDLDLARKTAYNLFNCSGYSSCWETLPPAGDLNCRTETFIKRHRMELKIEKFLKKCEKDVIKYIKKHSEVIKELADALYKNKRLKNKEILSILG